MALGIFPFKSWFGILCVIRYYPAVEDIPSAAHGFTSSVKAAWSRRWREQKYMKVEGDGCLSHLMAPWPWEWGARKKRASALQGCRAVRARAQSWGTWKSSMNLIPTKWMLLSCCTFGKGSIVTWTGSQSDWMTWEEQVNTLCKFISLSQIR